METFILSRILIIIVCLCNIQQSFSYSFGKRGNVSGNSGSSVFLGRERRKRTTVIGAAVIEGLRVAKTLLQGSKEVPEYAKYFKTAKFIREFEKPGGYSRALRDFHTVNPTNVHAYSLPEGNLLTVGYVGKTVIMTEKRGVWGKPHLEILQGIGTKDQKIDLILYKD